MTMFKNPTAWAFVTVSGLALAGCSVGDVFIAEPSEEAEPHPDYAVTVTATTETVPVPDDDDAADDPAIWVNPEDPQASLVITTNKRRGLMVHDLSGAVLSRRDAGRLNNVDVRTVEIAGEAVVIAAATNRTDHQIDVFRLDTQTGELLDILAARIPADMFGDPYGLCQYESAVTGDQYVIANDKDGRFAQWRLDVTQTGQIQGELVRQFEVGGQTEGCVADDATGVLFIGEEEYGIWRYQAEPDAGEARDLVDRTGLWQETGGYLSADVEGLSLYIPDAEDTTRGYLIASSQGNNAYTVYDRAAPNAWRGTFVIADGALDGAEETDGLDVTAVPLGPDYPAGLLVVQDGFNYDADGAVENQNFKYVSWANVRDALGLED
ncbi:phytase [Maricaulis sp. D1M11]|uniref:phytase n=1 Tax=Maricaulis sp. D1M11 TaxID=3076117 RepID=UPI0039B3C4BB